MAWSQPVPFADDFYFDWAQATGFQGVLAGQDAASAWLPLLVARNGSWADLKAEVEARRLPVRWQPDWPARLDIAPLWAQRGALAQLRSLVRGLEFSQPLMEAPVPAARPSGRVRWAGSEPPRVVVGVIDSGGAPLNRAFRFSDAGDAPTRLLSFWDQTRAAGAAPWTRPAAGYGRELDSQSLQALCRRASDAQAERALYLGDLDMPERARAADMGWVDHANHVLDTLAGLPSSVHLPGAAKPFVADPASRAALVMVAVPGGLPGQTTGAPSAVQLLDALHHIHRVAREAAPNALVLVNVSLGIQAGPRDDGLLLVRAVDELMAMDPGLLVMFAAGNRGRQPMLASGAVSALDADPVSVGWRIRPEDPTDSFLEAWWPAAISDAVEFRACAPGGVPSPWVSPGYQVEWPGVEGPLARLSVLRQGRVCLALAPVQGTPERHVPAGCWRLECRSHHKAAVPLWVMVQGDQPDHSLLPSVPLAQSYLEGVRGLSLAVDGAHNALCSGKYPIAVGAGTMENQRAAWYSAPVEGSRPRPGGVHMLAAADEAVLTPGLLATGVLSGDWVRMRGTSVAAPVAGRQVVNALAKGPRPARADQWRQALGIIQDAQAKSRLPVLRPDRPWTFGLAAAAS